MNNSALLRGRHLGFTDVLLPKGNLRGIIVPEGLRVHGVETLIEALNLLGLTAR